MVRLIVQKSSGTKFSISQYLSTTKPRVGNWQGPKKLTGSITITSKFKRTIADDLILKPLELFLKPHRLEPRESGSDAQIEFLSCINRFRCKMIRRGERAARVVDIAGRLVMMVSKHMDMVPGYEGGEVRSVNFDPTI